MTSEANQDSPLPGRSNPSTSHEKMEIPDTPPKEPDPSRDKVIIPQTIEPDLEHEIVEPKYRTEHVASKEGIKGAGRPRVSIAMYRLLEEDARIYHEKHRIPAIENGGIVIPILNNDVFPCNT